MRWEYLVWEGAGRLIHLGNGVVPQVALVVGHVLLGLDAKLRGLS